MDFKDLEFNWVLSTVLSMFYSFVVLYLYVFYVFTQLSVCKM